MRRFAGSRRPRHAAPSGAIEAAILALTPYSWLRADYYSIDGVTGKVGTLLDKVASGTGIKAVDATHALAQATSAQQCVAPASRASVGQLTLSFAGAQFYSSTAAASAWKFLHDGTGYHAFHVYEGSGSLMIFGASLNASLVTSRVGAYHGIQAATQASRQIAGNGASPATFDNTTTNGALSGEGTWVEFSYKEGSSPERRSFRELTSISTGASAAAPSTSDPEGTLRLGGDHGANRGTGYWAESIYFNRELSAGSIAIVQNYIRARYTGITL